MYAHLFHIIKSFYYLVSFSEENGVIVSLDLILK